MESTVEESKATSQHIHEDEFCYITDDGSLFRKANSYQEEKKLGEVQKEEAEDTLEEYRANFAELEEAFGKLNKEEGLSEDEAEQWSNKFKEARAIGDFEQLYVELQDLVKVAAEEEPAQEEHAEENAAEKEEEPQEQVEEVESPVRFYKNLTKEAQELAKEEGDWSKVEKQLNTLSHQWSDGPDVEDGDDKEQVKDLFYKFTKASESFEKRKEEYYKQAEKKRKENLSAKKKLRDDLKKIVDNKEWTATGKVKSLQNKWKRIGSVPQEHASELEEEFEKLVTEFKSHKVDRLVEKRQKSEDNLMMKMAVLDKMEATAANIDKDTSNWKEVDHAFSDLTKQWKKIGRVPREKANQVWSRYKSAQDAYYDKKYTFDIDHRSNVDSFSAKKENVIEKAEALLEQDDLAKAARKVNKLHHKWKKIGNLPQRKEDKLWDRFSGAIDAFNEKKSKNIDKIHEQEEEHYKQKLQLIEKVEELKDTTDWDDGHKKMQSFMNEWKKIGPVPRKKSNKIWKQFKGGMDEFYDRRRDHFKEAKEQQKDNLKKKQEILDKLRELGQHEDPIEAVDEAKKLQSQFKDIGYVPIKKKNEMWKIYREVCDVIYDRMRAAKSGSKFERELAKADLDADQRSQIKDLRKEYQKIKNEVKSLKDEVLQLEESKTNFNFSDENNPLLKQMEDNIAKSKAKLESKQNKMDALSMEMEDIRDEA